MNVIVIYDCIIIGEKCSAAYCKSLKKSVSYIITSLTDFYFVNVFFSCLG